jgi:hypothetical protein
MDKTWIESRVRALRSHYKIVAFDAKGPRSWVTLDQAAAELGLSRHAVRNLLNRHVLPGRQIVPCAPWVIQRKDLQLPAVQASAAAIRNGRKSPRSEQYESQVQLFQT